SSGGKFKHTQPARPWYRCRNPRQRDVIIVIANRQINPTPNCCFLARRQINLHSEAQRAW
ncbi:MAG: hypothetical protein AAF664_08085, partial [Planctomycetota bacterium]